MTEIDTLLPCPFCGGLPEVFYSSIPRQEACRIECSQCDTRKERVDYLSRAEAQTKAFDAWNTRALSSRTSNEAVVRALQSADNALKPLSDAVFNDNGDMTISLPLVTGEQCTSAYFAAKAIRSALVRGSAVPGPVDDWTVSASETAREVLNYLGIGSEASLEPGADRRRDNVAKIIARHFDAAVPGEDGWKPIDAEAKSGNRILAIENYQRASWDDEGNETLHQEEANVVWWSDKHNGWVSYGLILESFEPTHWQPLPAAPPLSQTVGEERT